MTEPKPCPDCGNYSNGFVSPCRCEPKPDTLREQIEGEMRAGDDAIGLLVKVEHAVSVAYRMITQHDCLAELQRQRPDIVWMLRSEVAELEARCADRQQPQETESHATMRVAIEEHALADGKHSVIRTLVPEPQPDPYAANQPQPRCNLCGRFASRGPTGEWMLRCVVWDDYNGAWEHA